MSESALDPTVVNRLRAQPGPVRRVVDVLGLLSVFLGDTAAGLGVAPAWSLLGISGLVWFGLALVALRHVLWPRPTLVSAIANRIRTYFRTPSVAGLWRLAIASRLIVIMIGAIAVMAPGYTRPPHVAGPVSENRFQDLPSRWDAQWYMSIARRGYRWNGNGTGAQQNIAFFPAYPLLMRVGGDILTLPAKVLRDPMLFGSGDARVLWGGVLVSVICFGFALQRVHGLALIDTGNPAVACRAVMLLCCYPFALFFGTAYSESLALLALAATVLAWRRGALREAMGWGLIGGLARSNGWALSLALLADWQFGQPRQSRTLLRLATALAPAFSMALFSTYIYYRTGAPLAWATAQRAWVGDAGPMTFLSRRAEWLGDLGLAGYLRNDPVDVISVAGVLLMLGIAVRLATRRQWLYAVMIVGYLAPALAIDLPAKGRLTAVLFPAFITMAAVTGATSGLVLAIVFAIGQAWLAMRFFQWQPPF